MKVWLFVATLILAAPPGNTGGCGPFEDSSEASDFYRFCLESRSIRCQRLEARGELSESGYADVQACVNDARDRCDAIADWPLTCQPAPRVRETDACLDELRRTDNLELELIPEDGIPEIPECRLCS